MADLFEDLSDPTFLDTDITDEENDDFDPLCGPTLHQDDNHEEMHAQSEVGDYPTAANLKEDHSSKIETTTVSIDLAQQNLWKQAKSEIKIVRDVFEKNHLLSGNHPSFSELATHMYGSKSKLFQLFEGELGL